jgi:small subunit ribosomal protein S2
MSGIDKQMKDESFTALAKKERLMIGREKEKLERMLGGIADLTRLPAAVFVVDVKKEHIAVAEAHKLGIPVFAMVDTNSNPDLAQFPIPANDDAFKSISLVTTAIGKAIEEALLERKKDKEEEERPEEASQVEVSQTSVALNVEDSE